MQALGCALISLVGGLIRRVIALPWAGQAKNCYRGRRNLGRRGQQSEIWPRNRLE